MLERVVFPGGGWLLRGVLVIAVGATAVACSRQTPTSPGTVSASGQLLTSEGGGAKVDICHLTSGANNFILISVAPAAVDAHLAHGDGRVGDLVPGQPDMRFDATCTPVPTGPVTITFAGLTDNLAPFTTYDESGFTVSAASGSWENLTTYGNPAPSIIFTRLASEPTISAEAEISAGDSLFRFTSVDIYSSVTTIPYVLTGLLNSTPVFSVSGVQPNTFGNFVTVTNPNSGDLIDTLRITLSNPATPCCDNPVGFDNVALIR
ncbi:MAG: hypothetical protein PVI01_19105 [Gemmatimonadales bacterium]|jgi:hypothetical protein